MITRNVAFSFILALGFVGICLASVLARSADLVGAGFPDRVAGVGTGLILALFSNVLAKRIAGTPAPGKDGARRFMGLAMVLAGLVYAGAFLLAPVELAPRIGVAVVVIAMIVTAIRFLAGGKASRSDPGED
ncbi:hypothetical protein [uncultured Maricaulis sp.]|jgi:hypothetical protein|uniref:hypothetical protein n=1 Tax=uncultured Maricaulis sp. TaxID=174710 RepID=UPI0030DD49FE|tara:strand:- start:12786 stop:13181 length:396 start_codon:yes stop_codon:yes gene_type:complete